MSRFTVTTPIFYVNARPHVGHAYAAVAADVLARAHRLRGDDVFFLTGTDEHGAKIAEAAAAAGKHLQAFADEVAGTFTNAWKVLDIQYDDFIRTTEQRHVQGVQHALRLLYDSGHLYEKSYRGLYCTGCENFLTEKDLDGEGKCPLHNRKPVEIEEKNWFFKLSTFADEIRSRIERDELRINPVERKNEVLGLFKQGIADFSISRPKERVPWSIPLPFDETQTCYVWVDALLNYITALGYGENSRAPWPKAHARGKYWPADAQIIGQDILKFHAVYWPALLLALHLPLPASLVVHGFFTAGGEKIGKSLGNAIDPLALVARYGSDAARYLLFSPFPFGNSGDVSVEQFDRQYDADLANTYGNLVSRTLHLAQQFCGSAVPGSGDIDATVAQEISAWHERLRTSPAADALAALNVLRVVLPQFGKFLNAFLDHAAPWQETDSAKRALDIRSVLEGIFHLASVLAPLLPRATEAVRGALGAPAFAPDAHARLPDGAPVTPLPILFPKQRHD